MFEIRKSLETRFPVFQASLSIQHSFCWSSTSEQQSTEGGNEQINMKICLAQIRRVVDCERWEDEMIITTQDPLIDPCYASTDC